MHLIACAACRRQYDVSHHPEGRHVMCLCGEQIEVRFREPHAPRAVRCTTCGGPVDPDSRRCSYCSVEVTIEERLLSSMCPSCLARMSEGARYCMECGIKIEPQALVPVPAGAGCPRCEGELRSRSVERTSLVECGGCAGIWLTPETFRRVCRDAKQSRRLSEAVFGEASGEKQAQRHPFRYLRCLTCRDFMIPRNFGGDSGVLIDVCRDHGVWLDHSELEKIVAYIMARGLEQDDPIQSPAPVEKKPVALPLEAYQPRRVHRSSGASSTLGDALAAIVDFFSGL